MEPSATHKTIRCIVCHHTKKLSEGLPFELVRHAIRDTIKNLRPEISDHDFICFDDLNDIRLKHIESILQTEHGALTEVEQDVIESLKQQDILSENLNRSFDRDLNFGERLSDKIANFGGSWPFIIGFFLILATWIGINAYLGTLKAFDPFPFILLNLVLSCLAAVQAPIIMMSQNRQEAKDRMRSELDYQVNLKAEIEIRYLRAKLDQLMSHQWQRLLEIQQIQTEIMREISLRK